MPDIPDVPDTTGTPARHRITVAAADHLARGRACGVLRAGHGKRSAIARLRPRDGVVCDAPRDHFEGGDPLQRFEIIGRVAPGAPYQAEMAPGVLMWRRDVVWAGAARHRSGPCRGRST